MAELNKLGAIDIDISIFDDILMTEEIVESLPAHFEVFKGLRTEISLSSFPEKTRRDNDLLFYDSDEVLSVHLHLSILIEGLIIQYVLVELSRVGFAWSKSEYCCLVSLPRPLQSTDRGRGDKANLTVGGAGLDDVAPAQYWGLCRC